MKRILFLTTLTLLFLKFSAFAESPQLFFSDLTDGPKTGWERSATKGAAVTVWGKNFGSSRGSNYVTVAGVDLTNDSNYAEWGVTANNARGLERITFWLNSSCSSGAQTISVTVGGVTSNTLPFYVRTTGTIYFVDHTNGNNSYNGLYATYTSGTNGPKKTIPMARWNVMVGGDILYIRNGTYTEEDTYGQLYVSGQQCGSANAMTAFVGYPGELPIMDTNATSRSISNIKYRPDNGDARYFTFAKIKMYPYGTAVDVSSATAPQVDHIRVVGIEADGLSGALPGGSTWAGCFTLQNMSYAWVYGCIVHHWGRDRYDHGTYIGAAAGFGDLITTDFEIGWNEFHDLGPNTSGIYVHPFDGITSGYADRVYIHDNLCYNMTHAGIALTSVMKDIYIYNNIVYDCGDPSYPVIRFHCGPKSYMTANVRFYNNTIYASKSGVYGVIMRGNGSTYMILDLKDNIIYSTSGVPYIVESGGTMTSDYDLYYGNGAAPALATHAINSKPSRLPPEIKIDSSARDVKSETFPINSSIDKLGTLFKSLVREISRYFSQFTTKK